MTSLEDVGAEVAGTPSTVRILFLFFCTGRDVSVYLRLECSEEVFCLMGRPLTPLPIYFARVGK